MCMQNSAYQLETDAMDKSVYYGSYWTDIWQVPLADDLLSVNSAHGPDAVNLAFLTIEGRSNTIED